MTVPSGLKVHPELVPYLGSVGPFTDPYKDIAAAVRGSAHCRPRIPPTTRAGTADATTSGGRTAAR
ncbi:MULTISPECIES: hypothetical protein [unclassified Streptomyces]|uniref:hypothetical protein n=1 Tax=unclassified Streptomyces TaxID=2593676 RepID=UPI00037D2380|nr:MULTISPECIES: hypothetical protein [unclassified Streptomyces]